MRIRLKEIRMRQFLSGREVARRSGVTPNAISDIERGKRWPKRDTMEKLAAALGVEIDDLVADDAPTPNTQDMARLRPAS